MGSAAAEQTAATEDKLPESLNMLGKGQEAQCGV